jgi:membrane fusion protein (multidrug efflux system)
LALLAACGEKPAAHPAAAAASPSVVAVPARIGAVTEQATFVGRVTAVDRVELRARVEGFLKERKFTEGQEVEVGDLLFEIEPELYESAVSQREADLAKAVADEENARAQLRRGEELLAEKNIAAAKVDELRAAESIAKASIAQAQAALDSAKLDLSYTEIRAPVAGRIGLARYSVGNLVGPGSDSLATLVSTDPIYVQFPVTQRERLMARQDIRTQGKTPETIEVLARLPDDSIYGKKGRLDFIDVTTDSGTDSVTVRAVFPNPDGVLIDGQFVGVLLQQDKPEMGITIPQAALQIDQQGVYVLVIDGEGKAQVRRIQTGAPQGASIAVKQGLAEGEIVIVEGIQKVRPGQPVSAAPPRHAEGDKAP